jgi:periplasmic divalent cation tolerance protein
MTEFVQITTTTVNRKDAERIAAELIARRLAGCVQVSGPIVSTFHWKGKTETQEEWVCAIKTGHNQLAAIEKLMAEIHPYKVPELIATPIVDGSKEYLAWLAGEMERD